ncbi:hypothetical protein PBY51_006457 [Eleginops maclovinus]|uniref:Endonuclease/exonuclease/phosphatase domain-containing protein n=1 Tax=Eleginops maclovinus TaxID=56733 RepID=A0AAN7WZJ3_ELEMC|nr:hypothetical protein PBY51_006457 [Eleginops maclovinus]
MRPSRKINHAGPPSGDNPMFLRQLSSAGPSFLPRRPAPLCRAGLRSISSSSSSSSYVHSFIPAPPPWWSVPGFPPRPPPHSAARQFFSCRTLPPQSFGGSCSFSTSAGLLMEHSDREPPHKRKKGGEERKGAEEREPKGGSSRDRGSKYHPDSHRDPRPDHRSRDGDRGASWENSRDKDVERTKSWSKDQQRKDETSTQRRSQSGGQHEGCRTPTAPKSKPEQDSRPRTNPWFKDRAAEGQGGRSEGSKKPPPPPEGQKKDRGSNGEQRKEAQSQQHPSTTAPNQWPGKPVRPLQRHWEASPACSTTPPPPGDSKAFDFSVMSYNILSQELLQDNAYLYRHCPPAVLPWEYRLPNLLAEIRQQDADILCLQEVQEDHYEKQIKPALQALGYQCEYKKRTGSKPDGCAVIFKSSRLSLLSSNPVEYFRSGDALLDRDNVGLVVLLRPNDSGIQSDPSAFVCVANTHLLYNPRRGDIKLAQLAILLAEINRLSRLPDGSTNPVVLCGDFNSTPRSPLYSFLTAGRLEYNGLQSSMVSGQESSPRGQRLLTSPLWSHTLGISHQCRYETAPPTDSSPSSPTVEGAISTLTVEDLATKAAYALHRPRIEHGLNLRSSYGHRLKDGRPEITTCHSRTATNVDYILYTPELVTPPSLPGGRGLTLLGRLSLVGHSELEEVNGLPNQNHSSDHLPIFARFRLQR